MTESAALPRARDLMSERFLVVLETGTVGDVARAFSRGSPGTRPGVAFATDTQGRLVGMLTPAFLLRAILSVWAPRRFSIRTDLAATEEDLAALVRDRFALPIHDIMLRGMAEVEPDDPLSRLLRLSGEDRADCFPVVDNGTPVGAVYVNDVALAAAQLALRPEDQGIAL